MQPNVRGTLRVWCPILFMEVFLTSNMLVDCQSKVYLVVLWSHVGCINFMKARSVLWGPDYKSSKTLQICSTVMRGSEFPFTCLVTPISNHALVALDWELVTREVAKHVDPWMGKCMTSIACFILTNTCLSNLPMHAICSYLLGDGVQCALDKNIYLDSIGRPVTRNTSIIVSSWWNSANWRPWGHGVLGFGANNKNLFPTEPRIAHDLPI
jgi:hypothetical protein